MRARLSIVVSSIVLAAAACTESSPQALDPGRTGSPVRPEVLLLGTDAGPLAIHVPGGSVVFERAGAVASPDGSRVFSASSDGRTTVLEMLESATGEVTSRTRIRGGLEIRVVSGSGRSVALMQPLPDGWDPGTPVPRSRTTIVVADPTGARDPRSYHLRGNFEPEAFSTDDSRLFLIQYLPAEAPAVYRVTVLDLARAEVGAVFGPFKTPPERMPGTRLQQVLSPDGTQLYTLYTSTRPGYAPHGAPAPSDGPPVSFVHVLDLADGWAHCVGLPRQLWDRPAGTQSVAASPDGRRLYIVDSTHGIVAVMDTQSLEILRTERVWRPTSGALRTSAQLTPDGRTLFVALAGKDTVLLAIDTTTFEATRRWPVPGAVSGLGVSGDGLRLYVALEDRVSVLDSATGGELGAVPLTGLDPVLRVSALAG